jgi:sn-glycerol 3-phosphate transport system substrate-binding protein
MKNIKAMMTLTLLSFSMIVTACGGKPNNSGTIQQAQSSAPAATASAPAADKVVNIEFWNTFSGTLGDKVKELLVQFEATHPNIKVKSVQVPYDAMLQTMLSAVAAKKPPSAVQLETTFMGRLATDGALAPIADLVTAAEAKSLGDSIIPSIREANSFNGKLYTVPMGYNSNVLYYNTKLIKDAGLTPADMPKTWDQLIEVSKKLTKDTNNDGQTDVYGYGFPSRAPWILEVRLWQGKAELFDQAGKKATFNSDAVANVFNNYLNLLNSKSAKMVPTDSAVNQLTDMFAAGQVAMFEQSSTAFFGIIDKAKFDVGVAQFPTMGDQVFSMGGYNLGIFKDAPEDQKKAAAELAKWWASPEGAAKWTSISNYMPGVQAAWDTDTLKNWLKEDPRRGFASQQMPYARPRPTLPAYPEISNMITDAFESSMLGKGTARENLQAAANKADKVLSK